jgi:hypothetical protein
MAATYFTQILPKFENGLFVLALKQDHSFSGQKVFMYYIEWTTQKRYKR